MKLSTKTRYGLRAVVSIAKVSSSGTPAKRKAIAAEQDISESYLENILIILKNNRIIEATRGANGGYVLSRTPETVTVLEIINALEGSIDLVRCIASPSQCVKSDNCAARSVWKELSESWNSTLGNITLKDLMEREFSLFSPSYSI